MKATHSCEISISQSKGTTKEGWTKRMTSVCLGFARLPGAFVASPVEMIRVSPDMWEKALYPSVQSQR